MAGMNKIIATANLIRDPKLSATADGVAICEMRVAIKTRIRGDDDVCFINVVAWEKTAESCGKNLQKGSWILIEGRIKLNQWESREGQKHSQHSIVAHRVVFLKVDASGATGTDETSTCS